MIALGTQPMKPPLPMSARDLSGPAFSIRILRFMQELTGEMALAFGSVSGIGEGTARGSHDCRTTANVVPNNAEITQLIFHFPGQHSGGCPVVQLAIRARRQA